MIGGFDIVIAGKADVAAQNTIMQVLRTAWPGAMVLDGFETPLPSEFFVYQDETSLVSWERDGATPENADSMIHVILGQSAVTCVVGGPKSTAIAEAIRVALTTCPTGTTVTSS